MGSACTSVPTEIIYEDLLPSAWRASISFIEKDEWKKVSFHDLFLYQTYGLMFHRLCKIFSMISRRCSLINFCFDVTSITYSAVCEGGALKIERDDFRPALDAWDTLKEECPFDATMRAMLMSLSV
jgi:hypothetical protein